MLKAAILQIAGYEKTTNTASQWERVFTVKTDRKWRTCGDGIWGSCATTSRPSWKLCGHGASRFTMFRIRLLSSIGPRMIMNHGLIDGVNNVDCMILALCNFVQRIVCFLQTDSIAWCDRCVCFFCMIAWICVVNAMCWTYIVSALGLYYSLSPSIVSLLRLLWGFRVDNIDHV